MADDIVIGVVSDTDSPSGPGQPHRFDQGDIVERVIECWSDTTIRTHSEACWEWHPHCAIAILAAEIERLRADNSDLRIDNRRLADLHAGIYHAHAAERALADQLAEALRDACDIRPFISVWQEAQKALTAYEEARCGW